ncbi:MAG: DNA mismatch repair protein MutS, partial [Candidatus Heimdallarchaeota archaeon]|nr:DNA mismatch repair protein MutS [Candidatus Heimdallarchaeota archaeon]
ENRSTFMVEMYECANILNNATENSLVILDEVGRGTSTYDGVAIAWSITEYLHDHIGKTGPRTLFATHYHELIELEEKKPRIKNYHVSIKNINGDIHFLYKVKEGGISESFGIHVASLAGLPKDVITNADNRLSLLHEQELEKSITKKTETVKTKSSKSQVSATYSAYEEIIENVSRLNLEDKTPVEAFTILNDLIKKSKKTLKEK